MLYDLLVSIALLMVFSMLWHSVLPPPSGGGIWIFRLCLLLVLGTYYVVSWKKRGQTIGMMAWKLCLITLDDKPMKWHHPIKRFFGAWCSALLLGFGFWAAWLRQDRLSMHDSFSRTYLYYDSRY